jgi:hypothetical protein
VISLGARRIVELLGPGRPAGVDQALLAEATAVLRGTAWEAGVDLLDGTAFAAFLGEMLDAVDRLTPPAGDRVDDRAADSVLPRE